MFFGRGLLRERPGKHEFCFEYCPSRIDQTVKGCRHPTVNRMLDPSLDAIDRMTGVALVPAPVEVFRGVAGLDHQDVGQVFGTDLPSFLAPQSDQGTLVV